MVVHDQQRMHTGIDQPARDRPRADAVVRHEPHQGGTVETGERGRRRDLQDAGVTQDRCRRDHLRGVEVAEVGERATIVGRPSSVRCRQRLAIFAGGVEPDQLDVCVLRALEGEFGTAQQVAP